MRTSLATVAALAALAGCGVPPGPPLVSANTPPNAGATGSAAMPQPLNSLPPGAAGMPPSVNAVQPSYLGVRFGSP